MTALEIEWGDPPPKRLLSGLLPVATALKERPGQWARVLTYSSGGAAHVAAQQIKYGHSKHFKPAGSFDAVSRDCDVWARYVGDPA